MTRRTDVDTKVIIIGQDLLGISRKEVAVDNDTSETNVQNVGEQLEAVMGKGVPQIYREFGKVWRNARIHPSMALLGYKIAVAFSGDKEKMERALEMVHEIVKLADENVDQQGLRDTIYEVARLRAEDPDNTPINELPRKVAESIQKKEQGKKEFQEWQAKAEDARREMQEMEREVQKSNKLGLKFAQHGKTLDDGVDRMLVMLNEFEKNGRDPDVLYKRAYDLEDYDAKMSKAEQELAAKERRSAELDIEIQSKADAIEYCRIAKEYKSVTPVRVEILANTIKSIEQKEGAGNGEAFWLFCSELEKGYPQVLSIVRWVVWAKEEGEKQNQQNLNLIQAENDYSVRIVDRKLELAELEKEKKSKIELYEKFFKEIVPLLIEGTKTLVIMYSRLCQRIPKQQAKPLYLDANGERDPSGELAEWYKVVSYQVARNLPPMHPLRQHIEEHQPYVQSLVPEFPHPTDPSSFGAA